MKITDLINFVCNKNNFLSVENYTSFCVQFFNFAQKGLQATIISQNEHNYQFFQYKKDGNYNISRPINSDIVLSEFEENDARMFSSILLRIKDNENIESSERIRINNTIYTLQQAIGLTLDALPAGKSNTARKINGDLFERLIRLILQSIGVDCRSGVYSIPVIVDSAQQFQMTYQHDLMMLTNGDIKVIGSVKTSSKDRLDKIFIDKFLFNHLSGSDIPHIAIFLNDVQRKKTKKENQYSVNSTFLPGHFKVYSIKLNPLDGVYYCDLRPNMKTDPFLKKHIKTIDYLLCEDVLRFIGN